MRWLCLLVVACLCLLTEGWLFKSRHKHRHNHGEDQSRKSEQAVTDSSVKDASEDYDYYDYDDSEDDEGGSEGIGEEVKQGFGFLLGTLGKMIKGKNDDEDNDDDEDYANDEDDEDYSEDDEDYSEEDDGAGGIMGSIVNGFRKVISNPKVANTAEKVVDGLMKMIGGGK